ncbi:MAG: hypothetical protein ACE14P_06320 [Methanotrichaceae archaeon]
MKNQIEEIMALYTAIGQNRKDTVLVEGGNFTVCLEQGRIIQHCPGAGKTWNNRRISAQRLARIAPIKRVIEVLQE